MSTPDEDAIVENWRDEPAAPAAFSNVVRYSGAAPRSVEPDDDIYSLGDDLHEREKAELRESLLRHEIFAEYPRLKGKETLLLAATQALTGQGALQIRNGSPAEIARIGHLIGETANDLRNKIAAEGQPRPRENRAAPVFGGSFPPGYFRRNSEPEQQPETLIQTIKRDQIHRRKIYTY